ncbi:MAG: hypothetical protein DWQ54_03590 [Microcystis flos-aquae TF09]|uniref:Uncharacterized protein n=1 Tax=Microcystis flos-aquae TF09 TaxID=2060473 RepID=A0A3E0LB28_9CHRO|nr:MAG: hypothetical protein DWQ54_03590 [Microcystis flos-aquae TF09]
MKTENRIFSQVYSYLEQGSRFVDKRHLTVLSWMVTALLSSQSPDRGTSKLKSLCSIKYRHRLQKKISHIYHI